MKKHFKKEVGQQGYTGRSGLQAAAEGDDNQQRVWSALRRMQATMMSHLFAMAGVADSTGQYYLNLLERAGYIWRAPGYGQRVFLLKDTGPQAPRQEDLRLKTGQVRRLHDPNNGKTVMMAREPKRWPSTPAQPETPEFKIWLAMRMLRTFTVGELVMVTELNKALVQRRVEALAEFRYLRRVEDSDGQPCWLLPGHRNTGRVPPAINRKIKKLYDFNTRTVESI